MPGDKVRPPAGNRRAEGDGFNVNSILSSMVEERWSAATLWSDELSDALELPEFDHRHPCRGCPVDMALLTERERA
jgi:hypothetical protein